ncbi:metal-dependent transcriptional regulator [Schaalia odontolytica]|uniref:Manganese transport regulator n=2 Tax=Schaalia odontolytica TaxID=1660 RepID=A0A857AB04_9ACTO|nr:metal-dependent transcriptional regulator [Schaalia odontolytica]EFF80295.1 iron dependent repressor DNA binding domain protein [Schaalia odontolytica F0309]QGS11203.1 winged helix DNA-binding protein [Schaalia odontolytica]
MSDASSNYSAVVEDILKLVWSAEEAGRDGVKPKDVSEHMDVVPSTATENIQRLARQGLVTHERYGRVRLTPQGRAIALGMVRRHRLLETYLHEALGFSWDEVHEEAEILEHAVSDRLLDRLDRVLGYPSRDPHGDPIPRADGSSDDVSGSPLDALDVTAGGIVVRLPDRDPEALRAWKEAGLVPGAHVAVVASDAGGVTVLLKDGQMLLLDSAQASGIVVRD